MEVLDDAVGEAGGLESFLDVLDDGGRLGRGFQDDGVAGEEGGNQGVDEDEVGVLVTWSAEIPS